MRKRWWHLHHRSLLGCDRKRYHPRRLRIVTPWFPCYFKGHRPCLKTYLSIQIQVVKIDYPLRIQTPTLNLKLEAIIVVRISKCLRKRFHIMKYIIIILTIFIQFSLKCMFLTFFKIILSQNKPMTFRHVLSSTSMHDQFTYECTLYITHIIHQTYLWMIIVYQTHGGYC